MRVFFFFARNLIFAAGELRKTDHKLLYLRFSDRALLGGGHGDVGAWVLGTAQFPVCHPGQNCPRAIASSKGTVTMEGEQGLQGQRENVPLSSQKGREMRNKAGSSSVSSVQHKICFSCSPRVLLALMGSPQKKILMLIQHCQTLGPSARLSAKGTNLSPVALGAVKPPQATRVASTPEPHSPGAHVSPAGIYGAQPCLGEASQGTGWGGDSWLRGWKSQPGTSCLLQEHVCTIFWRSQLLKRGK